MECRDVREQLNDLLDGQLSPELEEEVRIHLEECADCREEYEVLTLSLIHILGMKPRATILLRS